MADVEYISRAEKASYGLPCNEKSDGTLWAGKGYEKSLHGQLGEKIADAVRQALLAKRGERRGRFWVDVEERKVTMMIGESVENKNVTVTF
jgi:hypothetical protein